MARLTHKDLESCYFNIEFRFAQSRELYKLKPALKSLGLSIEIPNYLL